MKRYFLFLVDVTLKILQVLISTHATHKFYFGWNVSTKYKKNSSNVKCRIILHFKNNDTNYISCCIL